MNDDDIQAYRANFEAFRGGLDKQQLASYYDQWAESGDYDRHLNPERYSGPENCAQTIAKYYTAAEKKTCRVLDVAAGTGRVGTELSRLGFENIDALDPSAGMLEKARERGVYTQFYNMFIGDASPVPVPDDTYDGLCVSGGFGEGHIPCHALHEMIRVVKPGGMICISMREQYLACVNEYSNSLLPLMQNLEQSGKWTLEAKTINPSYAFGFSGVVFQFRVQ